MAKASKKEIAKRASRVLLNVGSAILAKKGLDKLNEQEFMQPKPDSTGKIGFPVVKTSANAGAGLAGAAVAILLKNEYLQEVGKGIATAGLMNATDAVIDAVGTEGTEGMGDTADKYLSMYDNLSGSEETVPLAGEETIVPIAGADDETKVPLAGESDLDGDDDDLSGDDDV